MRQHVFPARVTAAVAAALLTLPLPGRATPPSVMPPADWTAPAAPSDPGVDPPRLVVLITVDQLRGDYLDRFGANLTGGLLRFRDGGVFFVNARQDHAITATAPGHATLMSGRTPASTNIISNDLGVPDPTRPLVAGARGPGASPWRFHGSTLYDWVRAADPEVRMLSVARKDRGAILPVGTARANVFWWDADRFTTSTYYRDTLPTWVARWNEGIDGAEWTGREWRLLLPDSAYPEPDDQPWEGLNEDRGGVFPHVMSSVTAMKDFPWMDSLTLDIALAGARELALGGRGTTDLLAVGLSTLDAVGHDFGPDSREVHDLVVRIDRWLEVFMRELEQQVPAEHIVYVLTSDHGVATMPELLQARGEENAGRVSVAATMRRAMAPLQARFEHRFGVNLQNGVILADTVALASRGVNVDSLGEALTALFRPIPGVRRTWTPRTLAAAPDTDESARLWRRAIPAGYAWLALAEAGEMWTMTTSRQASHGWPSAENMSVPIVFMAPGMPAGRVDRVVRTVDIAPTLAALLGVQPTERLDGERLPEVLRATTQADAGSQ